MINQPILTIVVPCYNEEEVFQATYKQLREVMLHLITECHIHPESKILFVDDGSKDSTWQLIETVYKQDDLINGLKLSRNFGHQRALLAGLEKANTYSDCIISIDADLQDDIDVIKEFVLKYLEGYDIVYGVRESRKTDSFFKRTTAIGFYRIMEKLGLPLIYNHADYRLLSKRAVETLLQFKEVNLFLRGIVPLVGFKSTKVFYDRKERLAGESKYPFKKMISFAFDGLTSFSVKPIRFITILGFLSAVVSVIAGIYVFIEKLLSHPVSGWASIMISLWFIGGLLLMSIGLIGEYIGKIYEEVKQRPRYIIDQSLLHEIHTQQDLEQKQKVLN
ncbi:glycosyltransferase family 2 protein [Caldibacillus lycopersici]|uniref:Glycosyltransferase family 2 protein n=1 Tax=Perspicuibacillus lycopersici TaxID=1325689 RepID=A0AAE3ISX2_9BACI|nr:glycosyltransferase family 2 protein [Perspicuibacillus lycopersici]MCU9612134.1 glycosyltransferase family 2 protein [Perspicuibacillus lycopersici]